MLSVIWFKTLTQHELDNPREKIDKLDSPIRVASLVVVE